MRISEVDEELFIDVREFDLLLLGKLKRETCLNCRKPFPEESYNDEKIRIYYLEDSRGKFHWWHTTHKRK